MNVHLLLPLLLCLVPLGITAASWRFAHLAELTISKSRVILYRGGLVLNVLSLLVVSSCWIDPYPLTRAVGGELSIAWLDRAWITAFRDADE